MSFIPYLHFDGTCAEAMATYAGLFGATDLQMMRYDQAPGDTAVTARDGRIMHAQFTASGGAVLMGSDFPSGHGSPQAGVSVMQVAPTLAEGARIAAALAEGGSVMVPWGPTFFAAGFAMLSDRFGTHWIISAAP